MIMLSTPRLRLEPLSLIHAPAFQLWLADEGIARMSASFPHPYPDGEAERYISSRTAGADPRRPTFFAILYQGEPIGGVMLFRFPDTASDEMEIGYWIARPFWGQGLAGEAVSALIPYGFGAFDLAAITAATATDNPASQRVLTRLGFISVGETERASRGRGGTVQVRLWRLAVRNGTEGTTS